MITLKMKGDCSGKMVEHRKCNKENKEWETMQEKLLCFQHITAFSQSKCLSSGVKVI